MENNYTQNTPNTQGSKVLIYIIIAIIIVALVWLVNKNSSEKFSNEQNRAENVQNLKSEFKNKTRQMLRKIKPSIMNLRYKQENESSNKNNSSMNAEDIDEHIRKQAIIAHQLHLVEMEQNDEKNKQMEQPVILPFPLVQLI